MRPIDDDFYGKATGCSEGIRAVTGIRGRWEARPLSQCVSIEPHSAHCVSRVYAQTPSRADFTAEIACEEKGPLSSIVERLLSYQVLRRVEGSSERHTGFMLRKATHIRRLFVLLLGVSAPVAVLVGCTGKRSDAAEDCGWIGMNFVMSEQALDPTTEPKAENALTQAIEGLGFKRSREQPWHFDNMDATSIVQYLVVEDSAHSNGTQVHPVWVGFRVTPHGKCSAQYNQNSIESYLGSITPQIAATLQPYATEKVKTLGTIQSTE